MSTNKVVSFRVTDEEYKQIKKSADKSLRTVSNWLRKKVSEEIAKTKKILPLIIALLLIPSCVFAENWDSSDQRDTGGGNHNHHIQIPRYDLEDTLVYYVDGKYWFDNEGKMEQAIGVGFEVNDNGVYEVRVGYSIEWGRNDQ